MLSTFLLAVAMSQNQKPLIWISYTYEKLSANASPDFLGAHILTSKYKWRCCEDFVFYRRLVRFLGIVYNALEPYDYPF